MRIQHNIMAMSAYRNYTNNVSAMKKNLEKLSSGYKINRAGDDAAGLAISEKMRAQITGLETAQKNAKDGISLVQTAEGALTEVHDMLNRMVELATMSANGTYDNDTDRAQLQKELDQLNSEIDRIADSANFNGIKLLNGEMDGEAVKITAQASQGNFTIGGTGTGALPAVADNPYADLGVSTVLHKGANGNAGTNAFGVELHKLSITGDKGDTFKLTIGDAVLTGTLQADATDAAPLTGADVASALTGTTTKVKFTLANGNDYSSTEFTVGGAKFQAAASGSGYGVTFTQKADDTTALTSVAFDVKVEKGTDVATGKNPPTVTNTAGADDSKKFTAGATDGTGSLAGQANTIDMSTGNLATGNAATIKGLTLNVGGVTVSLADLAITDGTTSMADTLTAIKGAIDKAVAAADTAGKAGNADYNKIDNIAVTADGNTGFKVTFDKTPQTYSATGGGATAGQAVVDFGTKTGADVLGSTITVGDKTYEFIAAGGTAATGNTAVTVTDTDTAAQLATKLKNAAAAAAPTGVTGGTGIAVGTSAGVDDMKVTFTTDDTGAGNDLAAKANNTKINVTVKGDYNVKTTDQSVKAPAADDRLASTNFSLTQDMVSDGAQIRIGEQTYTFSHEKTGTTANTVYVGDFKATDGTIDLTKAAQKLTDVVAADTKQDTYTVSQKDGKVYVVEKNGYTKADNSQKYDLTTEKGIAESLGFNIPGGTTTRAATGKSLTLQIGDTADKFNQLSVNIQDMHANKLGQKTKENPDGTITIEDATTLASINIKDQKDAATAIDVIKRAINQVSDVRGTLGATQNRLDHTINNLSVMTENIQDAESTIRDVDVAEEMMAYTKNNILIQSAQAMLAQANQVPQGVLQLLQ